MYVKNSNWACISRRYYFFFERINICYGNLKELYIKHFVLLENEIETYLVNTNLNVHHANITLNNIKSVHKNHNDNVQTTAFLTEQFLDTSKYTKWQAVLRKLFVSNWNLRICINTKITVFHDYVSCLRKSTSNILIISHVLY